MSELSLTCPRSTATGGSGAGSIDLDRRVIVRTGGCFEADTPLSIQNPGPGWAVSGNPITYSGASEFQQTTQIFVNGAIQQTALSAVSECDVYFVSTSGSQVAFDYNIDTNDVIQVWKFAASGTTTSG